jgi:hypothetical protein
VEGDGTATPTVIDLAAERESRDPHMSGEARCIACGHVWTAVAPVGTTWLECPECRTEKGLFTGACLPEGGEMWTCECGCEVFFITPHAVQCYNCGAHQHGMWDRAG